MEQVMTRYYVYLILNLINGKGYTGKTNNYNERWMIHKKVARGGKEKYPKDFYAIHAAISKYGEENFSFQILEETDNEKEANDLEIWWIGYLGTHVSSGKGYNLTHGGDGITEETMKKIISINKTRIGEMASRAKLKEISVIEIINKWFSGLYTQRALAQEYNINYGTICDIIHNRTWKHISRPSIIKENLRLIHKENKLYSKPGINAKLSGAQVIDIIKSYNSGDYTQKELGEKYGVSRENISSIISNRNWKYIER